MRSEWLVRLITWVAVIGSKWFKVRVFGLKNLPSQGPVLLLPKHHSWLDTPVLGATLLERVDCLPYNIAKPSYASPRLGNILIKRVCDLVHWPTRHTYREQARTEIWEAVDIRNQAFLSVLDRFKFGHWLVAFPEGGRFKNQIGDVWHGAGILWATRQIENQLDISVPIIPVGISYESFWRPGAKIRVHFGNPIHLTHYPSPGALYDRLSADLACLSGLQDPREHAAHIAKLKNTLGE